MSFGRYIPFQTDWAECFSDQAERTRLIYEDSTPFMLEGLATVERSIDRPFVIAEYGSADGGGSYDLIRKLIGFLRKRDGDDFPICIIYEDQPINNFKPIFLLSNGEKAGQRGLNEEFTNVFVLASGTSFFQKCLPASSVDFLFSPLATHWLSRCPCNLDDTMFSKLAHDRGKVLFQQQAAADWEEFLVSRASELRPGGCMVLYNLSESEENHSQWFIELKEFKTLDRIWRTMMEEGIITKEEFENTNIPFHLRTKVELEAPFKNDNSRVCNAGLRLVSTSVQIIPGLYRDRVDEHPGDRATRARCYVQETKAWMEATFRQGLGQDRTETEIQKILEIYYSRFFEKLVAEPSGIGQLFCMLCMVIKKTG